MCEAIKNRYDFVILFDVENGNPNGDPDAGNMPRIDPETGHGIVTDVCMKRKIRNYVQMVKEGDENYHIYINDSVPLNRSDAEACAACGVKPDKLKDAKKSDPGIDEKLRDWLFRSGTQAPRRLSSRSRLSSPTPSRRTATAQTTSSCHRFAPCASMN